MNAGPLTQAIQRLNSNPYNLTKAECIQVIRELRDEIVAASGAELTEAFNGQGWRKECADADALLMHLGLDPAACRTDGGWLNLPRIKALLEAAGYRPGRIAAIVAKMRADLSVLGGFENGMVSVPASGVRVYIEKLEAALGEPAATPMPKPRPWPELLLLLNDYASAMTDAAQHQAASKVDIAKSQAMKALRGLREAIYGDEKRYGEVPR